MIQEGWIWRRPSVTDRPMHEFAGSWRGSRSLLGGIGMMSNMIGGGGGGGGIFGALRGLTGGGGGGVPGQMTLPGMGAGGGGMG
jgi:hypothetical protein